MSIRILIVEDNEDSFILLREFLKRTFPLVKIEHTVSARIALSKMKDTFFDLVFSDMGLIDPFIGGGEVIEYAKQRGSYTVLYSAGEDKNIKPDFILAKPFNFDRYQLMLSLFAAHSPVF
jgi:CheY-like chemotaxis protein